MRGALHHLGERHTHCNPVALVTVAVHLKQCLRQRSVTQERKLTLRYVGWESSTETGFFVMAETEAQILFAIP
jgi:hypothetical protein